MKSRLEPVIFRSARGLAPQKRPAPGAELWLCGFCLLEALAACQLEAVSETWCCCIRQKLPMGRSYQCNTVTRIAMQFACSNVSFVHARCRSSPCKHGSSPFLRTLYQTRPLQVRFTLLWTALYPSGTACYAACHILIHILSVRHATPPEIPIWRTGPDRGFSKLVA